MWRKLVKLFYLAFVLFVPLGLVIFLLVDRRRPFGLMARLFIILKGYGKLIPYLVAQSKHETANFTSNIYRTHNNLFGMKHPSKRPSVGEKGDQAPDGGNYQRYASPFQSVRDQLFYLGYVNFPKSVDSTGSFVNALADRGYFGSNPSAAAYSAYLNGVNHFIA